eukprot:gene13279-15608_t
MAVSHLKIKESDIGETLSLGHLKEVTNLEFIDPYDKVLLPGQLPPNLTQLTLKGYNQVITPDCLPASLTNLSTGPEFNQPIALASLTSLTDLDLGYSFNQPLDSDSLPRELRFFTLTSDYHQNLGLDILPPKLEYFILGSCNHPFVQGVLPDSLTFLLVCYEHNQPFHAGVLPPNLTDLVLSEMFDQPFTPGILPSKLTHLTLSNNMIPIDCYPPSVNDLSLEINSEIQPGSIPASIRTLNFGFGFDHTIQPGTIPPKLETLSFGSRYNKRLPQEEYKDLDFVLFYISEQDPEIVAYNVKLLLSRRAMSKLTFTTNKTYDTVEFRHLDDLEQALCVARDRVSIIQLSSLVDVIKYYKVKK